MSNFGLSHKDRYLKQLDAEYFKIDERTLSDFIDFTLKFSKYINYYNLENSLDGNGSVFFNNDITILLIKISSLDLKSIEEKFESKLQDTYYHLDPVLEYLYDLLSQVQDWNSKTLDEEEFNSEINKLINSKFSKYLKKLQTYHELYYNSKLCTKNVKILYFQQSSEWQNEYNEHIQPFEKEMSKTDIITQVIDDMYSLFNSILSSIELIVESSQDYKQKYMQEGNTKPHIALFIAFIEMYKNAQNDINKFTQRHLTYYYNQILHLYPIPEIPDKVHIAFELQDGIKMHKLAKGLELSAGQDSEGKNLTYELDEEIIVTEAYIEKINTIVNQSDSEGKRNNNMETVFLNLDINKDLFSEEKLNDSYEFGFALASSFLKLSEGDRTINFTIELQRYAFDKFMDIFNNQVLTNPDYNIQNIDDFIDNLFCFTYSTINSLEETEWITIPDEKVITSFQKNNEGNCINKIDLSVEIDILYPPIDACLSDEYPQAKERKLPVCKFLLHNNSANFYNFYKLLIIEKITINTKVDGIRNLKVQNDYGPIDSNFPFEPFGAMPTIGSTFYLGHDTIFSQHLDNLEIVLEWMDPPLEDNGFPEYYNGYSNIESNDIFKAQMSFLKDRKWLPNDNHQIIDLFQDDEPNEDGSIPVKGTTVVNDIDLKNLNFHFKGAPIINEDEYYSRISKNGFLKFEFTYPPNGFGHKEYPEIVKKQAGKAEESTNPPWTPTLRSISVNYESNIIIDIHNQDRKNRAFVYHLHPFGKKLVSEPVGKDISLFPYYNEGSEILLGIKEFNELEILTIYFHINEFASDFIDEKALVEWSFLNNDEWVQIKYDQIIKDSTDDLTSSGIIMFDLPSLDPEFFNIKTFSNSYRLPSGYFWLKCNSTNGEDFVRNIDYIKCHAATATFKNNDNAQDHLKAPLLPNSIDGFVDEQPAIKTIEQSYSSFKGKAVEDLMEFQIRVSERLNHKNRAITKWDYEHIILQDYNDINKVICINNINIDLEPEPGSILLVIIPKINEEDSKKVQEPKSTVSRLQSIKQSIINRISPFVNIDVCNPIYEQVQVKFDVKFHKGLNERYYLQKVNEDVKDFLNPWHFGSDIDEAQTEISNRIYAMHIVYFLETRDYIDYVSNIAVFHIVDNNIVNLENANENNAAIKPLTDISIFVSAPEHIITVVGGDDRQEAIGSMIVGKDFSAEDVAEKRIYEGINKDQIEINYRVKGEKTFEDEEDNYTFIFKDSFI